MRIPHSSTRPVFVTKLLVCAIAICSSVTGQTPPPEIPSGQQLVNLIAELDAKVVTAYFTCDPDTLLSMMTPDVELYHDEVGRFVGREAVRTIMAEGICDQLKKGDQIRPELVPESLIVYRLEKFGALEFSTGTIWRRQHGEAETKLNTIKEITVWQQRDGVWMIARHIAYAHEPVKEQ